MAAGHEWSCRNKRLAFCKVCGVEPTQGKMRCVGPPSGKKRSLPAGPGGVVWVEDLSSPPTLKDIEVKALRRRVHHQESRVDRLVERVVALEAGPSKKGEWHELGLRVAALEEKVAALYGKPGSYREFFSPDDPVQVDHDPARRGFVSHSFKQGFCTICGIAVEYARNPCRVKVSSGISDKDVSGE